MKITDYRVIMESEISWLRKSVEKEMKEGWQPQGGIGVGVRYFYQAMVRYEEEPKDKLQTIPPKKAHNYPPYNPNRGSYQ